jgi:hypothetical protein
MVVREPYGRSGNCRARLRINTSTGPDTVALYYLVEIAICIREAVV